MLVYAYSDETEFNWHHFNPNAESIIGCGLLMTKQEISEMVIKEALDELSNERIKTSKDIKTLKRGFFHASEDSPNGHSCLCKSINKHISGCFRFSYYDKEKGPKFKKSKSDEDIKRLTLQLSALELFYKKLDKVVLTIENRKGFSKTEINKWQKEFYNILDGLAYSQPSFLTFYPNIEIHSGDKRSPGLQVVDFILWALNRSKRPLKDLVWKQRLNFKFSSEHYQEDAAPIGGHYYLNELPEITKEISYPIHDYDSLSKEEFFQSYITIEQTIRSLSKIELPKPLEHFNSQFLEVKNLFEFNKSFTENNLIQVASLYIRLFDTLPIYHNLDNSDLRNWSLFLKAKKTAGLILRQDLIEGYRSAMAILDWREEIMKRKCDDDFLSFGH